MEELDSLRVASRCDDRSRRGFFGTAPKVVDLCSGVSLLLDESPRLLSTDSTTITSLSHGLDVVSLLRFIADESVATLSTLGELASAKGQADNAEPSP